MSDAERNASPADRNVSSTNAPAGAAGGAVSPRTLQVTIDGRQLNVVEGTSIWEAAYAAGIEIPVLCHQSDANKTGIARLNPVGVCRVCAVEVEKQRFFVASCVRPVDDGMIIRTDTERLLRTRRTLVELLLADHPAPCKKHRDTGDCELEVLAEKLGVLKPAFTGRTASKGTDFSNPSIAIDHSACIVCDRCVRACTDVVQHHVIGRSGKGYFTAIGFDDNKPMGDSSCVNCGECMISCPTGAITYAGGVSTDLRYGESLTVEELKQIPMFARISSQFLKRSEGAVVRRKFNKGDILCRQGEFGSTAFYIESGRVDVYLETNLSHVRTQRADGLFKKMTSLVLPRERDQREEEGSKRYIPIDANVDLPYADPIASVEAGELIGEAACLNHQPRSATMRATEETVVLEMLRNALDILRRNREFKAEMQRKYRDRALSNHLRTVPGLRDLPPEFVEELRERVELVSYGPGEEICRQGEPADAFYLVRMGHVKVYVSYQDNETLVLSYLSRSQYFGEMGLLGGGVRTASCSALDHVELVRISRADFELMVSTFPAVRAQLEAVAREHEESNRLRLAQPSKVSLQQYVDQGLYEAQSLLVLDLEKCTRCDECVRACAQAHDGVSRLIRDGLRYEKYLVTTSCRSCRDPLCMVGCPVGSIRRKNDLEIIIEDHCIGCGRCAEQCPYGNINMQPFEQLLPDPQTGRMEKREWRKATVCDLCSDQCLSENDDPSCVYACPHDAAHRVDGKEFFDTKLSGTVGSPHAEASRAYRSPG